MNLSVFGVAYSRQNISFGEKSAKKIVQSVIPKEYSPDSITKELNGFLANPNKKNLVALKKMYQQKLDNLNSQRNAFSCKFANGDVIFENSKCLDLNEKYTNLNFMVALDNAIVKLEQAIKNLG